MMRRTALITIARGRHRHLRRQIQGVARTTRPPDLHIVVAMSDPEIRTVAGDHPATIVIDLPVRTDTLPLARARNVGARRAIEAGAELLVFLDVDCIPGTKLVEHYRRAAETHAGQSLLFCGPVTYLRPDQTSDDLTAYTNPHPARPAPVPGHVVVDDQMTLFWSLSFALNADHWQAIGGFHEEYRGYGGEDTDFAMLAADRGFAIAWVGGADAYHQHHPVSDPPVEHVDDILRNGEMFRRRWGHWPMGGWLRDFEAAGLIVHDEQRDLWRRTVIE